MEGQRNVVEDILSNCFAVELHVIVKSLLVGEVHIVFQVIVHLKLVGGVVDEADREVGSLNLLNGVLQLVDIAQLMDVLHIVGFIQRVQVVGIQDLQLVGLLILLKLLLFRLLLIFLRGVLSEINFILLHYFRGILIQIEQGTSFYTVLFLEF